MSMVDDSPGDGEAVEKPAAAEPVEEVPNDTDETAVSGDVPPPASGRRRDGCTTANRPGAAEVIIGEIPDVHDLAHMLWTARCSEHGLLGHFESRDEAEQAKATHLESAHR